LAQTESRRKYLNFELKKSRVSLTLLNGGIQQEPVYFTFSKKELPLGIQKIEESNLLTVQCALYSVSRVFYLCIHEREHKSAMRAGCGNNER
jgi:hypothetical protein